MTTRPNLDEVARRAASRGWDMGAWTKGQEAIKIARDGGRQS